MERDVKQPDYLGHRQRLRQRFLLGEGKDMADYELLELVLTMAIPRRDVKPLAKKLIAEFNDFSGVINAPAAALLEVDGVKENTLAMLKVIKAAAIRTSWQTLCAAEAPVIRSPDTLLEYCRTSMCHSDVEELRIIFMDAKLQVIGEETMQRGTINAVAVHPPRSCKICTGASRFVNHYGAQPSFGQYHAFARRFGDDQKGRRSLRRRWRQTS